MVLLRKVGVLGRLPATRGRAVALRVEPPGIPSSRPCRASIPDATQPGRRCRRSSRGGLHPVPGDRGPDVRHAAHDRRPLGDRGGLASRCARCSPGPNATPVTATPEAGPLSTLEVIAAARPSHQSSADAALVARRPRGRRGSWRWAGFTATAAPGELARRPRRCAGRAESGEGSPCASRPTALPPQAPVN